MSTEGGLPGKLYNIEMEALIEKVKSLSILLIGGAPRSGTTLLLNQLDGHPEILGFPMEHKTIENFFWNESDIEHYAKTDFITKKRQGQQSILANQKLIDAYAERMQLIYQKEFVLQLNTETFKAKYLEFLNREGVSLKNMLYALGYALISSNDFAFAKLETLRYLAFKQPFFTELFAENVKNHIPDVKIIHMLRDPLSRYISAKARRVKESKLGGRRLNHINGVNYVEGHTAVDITTRILAEANMHRYTEVSYNVLSFEIVMRDTKRAFNELYTWLGVAKDQSFLRPSRLGIEAFAGSSMIKDGKGKIDKSSVERNAFYLKGTSWNERYLHSYYLYKSKYTDQGVKPGLLLPLIYLIPLPQSNWKNLIYQYTQWYKILMGSGFKWDTFIDNVKKRLDHVSGSN